jgi:sortase A
MERYIHGQISASRQFPDSNPIGLILRAQKNNWTEEQAEKAYIEDKWFDRFHGVIRFVSTFTLSFIGLFILFNFPAYGSIASNWIQTNFYGGAVSELRVENSTLPYIGTRGEVVDQAFAADIGLNVDPPDFRIEIPGVFEGSIPVVETDPANLEQNKLTDFEGDIQDSLRKGAVHYPYTALPGEIGNTFITAHSSYYPWDPGKYKSIFALLPGIKLGTVVTVNYGGKEFSYRVYKKHEVSPSQTDVLRQPQDKKILTLMTCTPIGTTINRLIVEAELIENPEDQIGETIVMN